MPNEPPKRNVLRIFPSDPAHGPATDLLASHGRRWPPLTARRRATAALESLHVELVNSARGNAGILEFFRTHPTYVLTTNSEGPYIKGTNSPRKGQIALDPLMIIGRAAPQEPAFIPDFIKRYGEARQPAAAKPLPEPVAEAPQPLSAPERGGPVREAATAPETQRLSDIADFMSKDRAARDGRFAKNRPWYRPFG